MLYLLNCMCPEILTGQEFDPKQSDLFSAAITLFILISKHAPFKWASHDDRLYQLLIWRNYDEFWRFHSHYKDDTIEYSEEFKDLFISMVSPAPVERLTIKKIKTHQWFLGIVPDEEELKQKLLYVTHPK